MSDTGESIRSVFLLILAVSGNFVAETIGCKTQKLLQENMIAKHFITLLILYFAIGFSSNEAKNPLDTLKLASFIYTLFILFTKMSINFTIAGFGLLTAAYVINDYVEYYKETDKDSPIIDTLQNLLKIIYACIILLILTGSGLYFVKQRKDYANNWSTTKFLFGKVKCKSLDL